MEVEVGPLPEADEGVAELAAALLHPRLIRALAEADEGVPQLTATAIPPLWTPS